MATIGHTLVGLALSETARPESTQSRLAAAWPGVMVLSAHGLDIVEWGCQAFAPSAFDTHFASASGWIGLGIALAAMGLMYLLGRINRPACYLAIGVAIFSHVLLDSRWWRIWTVNLYDYRGDRTGAPPLREAIICELWLYGLIWILMLLVQTIRRSKTNRMPVQRVIRKVSIGLGLICIIAAATRLRPLWAGVFCVTLLGALWVRRGRLNARLLWNLPLLLPLLVMVGAELLIARLDADGDSLRRKGEYSAAVDKFRRAERIPSRMPASWRKVHLGQCLAELGEPEAAEREYLLGVAMSEEPNWAKYWLARFYFVQGDRYPSFHRPARAKELFEELILANPSERDLVVWCKEWVQRIENASE